MAFRFGAGTVSALRLGSVTINKVYQGALEVFDGGGGAPTTLQVVGTPVTGNSPSGANHTSHTISFPTHQSGDLLLALFSCDGVGTHIANTAGWAYLGTGTRSSNVRGSVWAKIAAGAGETLVVDTSNESSSFVGMAFRNAGLPTAGDIAFSNTFGAADPPALSPAGGSAEYAWVVAAFLDQQSTPTNPPADFIGYIENAHPNTYGASIAAAYRLAHIAGTYDPGAFDNGSQNVAACTIAISAA
ncbi:MAG: hypothetical protein AAGC92_16450 [Pseudomonadota bacterium]